MIHQKIEKLIPYLSENFITYPLCEEGKYIPFVNFWQKIDNEIQEQILDKKLKETFDGTGYFVIYQDSNYSNTILQYSVCPTYFEIDNGGYKFEKESWSIEEMLELLWSVLK